MRALIFKLLFRALSQWSGSILKNLLSWFNDLHEAEEARTSLEGSEGSEQNRQTAFSSYGDRSSFKCFQMPVEMVLLGV